MNVLRGVIQDENEHDGGAHDHHDGSGGDSYQACILLCKKYHTIYNPLHLIHHHHDHSHPEYPQAKHPLGTESARKK